MHKTGRTFRSKKTKSCPFILFMFLMLSTVFFMSAKPVEKPRQAVNLNYQFKNAGFLTLNEAFLHVNIHKKSGVKATDKTAVKSLLFLFRLKA